MAFNYVPINQRSGFQPPSLRPRSSFSSNPSLSTRSTKTVANGQRREPNMSAKRAATIHGWPRNTRIGCVRVCAHAHIWCIQLFAAHTRETTVHTYMCKSVTVCIRKYSQRQECALRRLPVGLFTYVSIKRRGVISSSGAAGRYKSWKWSL